jgi:hypothetical protein
VRDDQIHRMHEMSVRREVLLLRQFEFLQTRMTAFENVLSTPWHMIKAVFNPAWLYRMVDIRQKELLAEADKKFKEAQAKPVIKPVLVKNGNG